MAIDLRSTDPFSPRHIGPSAEEQASMLAALNVASLEALVEETVPAGIRLTRRLDLPPARTEHALLNDLQRIAAQNRVYRSFLGLGYADTITPPVIQRGVLENPNWYTQYTPYQAEIAQGRLEALLNFQTMVIDLTGLPVANASLLDEGTAAAEAMLLFHRMAPPARHRFFVAADCHPQTIAVVQERAEPMGVDVVVAPPDTFHFDDTCFGVLVQYPTTDGVVRDYRGVCEAAHAAGAWVVAATDLLSLTLLTPPGEWGADVAVGNTQRFGVPLGYGGPHAAFFAAKDEFKRQMPGRIIGVTVDAEGNPALRMALQTREQHIRRDKATSNICTAQVLLAVIAAMYAVWHGPGGLRRIAERVHNLTRVLAAGLERLGHRVRYDDYFDTLRVDPAHPQAALLAAAEAHEVNLRAWPDGSLGIALDETTSADDVDTLLAVFGSDGTVTAARLADTMDGGYAGAFARTSDYLTHPVFNRYHSESEMMRYLHRLASRDLSLTTSMIPLGSCTMKLNAAAELMPITWAPFNRLHPFVPLSQAAGYQVIREQLAAWLAEITGFAATSLQPNSGASGEYTGLLVIRAWHHSRGEAHRNICLIPMSAHGTNPASAIMAGMEVVPVRTDEQGNVDVADLRAKAEQHRDRLAALMITYPSTHGVFEATISDLCQIIHAHGGQVYMDGANMNAQVGLCRPGDFGADVCHLNLHKTFAIPHGGGGPGMGPICVAAHLAPFLPGHPLVPTGGAQGIGPVAAAPFGSASILLISWAYIALMGAEGLREATATAILNANYMAKRLEGHYDILYRGAHGRVAHEFIIDLRPLKASTGISEMDVAKRLMDYGYHAPTVSFPVAGTLMIEPTESESQAELDRFCDAMIAIRAEIEEVALGLADRELNVLRQAPHTAAMVVADDWALPYSREKAAFPAPWTRQHKFWPAVRRVNDAYGDRNLVCACPPMEVYAV
jgi:glycine dehydrogenase